MPDKIKDAGTGECDEGKHDGCHAQRGGEIGKKKMQKEGAKQNATRDFSVNLCPFHPRAEVHCNQTCIEGCIKRQSLNGAFKQSVPKEIYDELSKKIKN